MNFWNFSYLQFTLGSKLWYLDIMWRNNIKRFEKNMPLQGDGGDKTCDNYFSKNTSYMCALEHHICSRNSKSIKRFVQLNRIQLNVVLTYFSNDGRRSKRWTRGQPPISPMSLTYWSDLIKLENKGRSFLSSLQQSETSVILKMMKCNKMDPTFITTMKCSYKWVALKPLKERRYGQTFGI